MKSAVSAGARGFNRLLHAFGTESPKADFFGHPFSHPLAEPYYQPGADPVRRLRRQARRLSLLRPPRRRWQTWQLDPHEDEDGFRHAATAFFRDHEAVYELRAQLWTDAATQPIEDASVEWPTAESPYRTVATLRLPAQDAPTARPASATSTRR